MPREEDVKQGSVLAGRYRIEKVLGRGGVGFVVLAGDLQLKRLVAIKLLRNDQSPEAVARFVREANAAVQLVGEHSVRVLDVDRLDDGAPLLVMEYLQGEDLSARLRRSGRVPVTDAVDYILQACEGIAEAHALGIVHRDIKLGNLFLTQRPNGTSIVKVVDFGLAKTTRMEGPKITGTSAIIGSPDYMSPEQVKSTRDQDPARQRWWRCTDRHGNRTELSRSPRRIRARYLLDQRWSFRRPQWLGDEAREVAHQSRCSLAISSRDRAARTNVCRRRSCSSTTVEACKHAR